MVCNRLQKCRRILQIDTQQIRFKVINKLEEMFDCAQALSRNTALRLNEREKWAKIAATIAKTINSVSAGFDEQKVNRELDELEDLVNKARAKAKV
jgi:ArsR family metal-binding transcriptional regulator